MFSFHEWVFQLFSWIQWLYFAWFQVDNRNLMNLGCVDRQNEKVEEPEGDAREKEKEAIVNIEMECLLMRKSLNQIGIEWQPKWVRRFPFLKESWFHSFWFIAESFEQDQLTIFQDVEEEFAEISKVMERFEKWRVDQSASYNDAYVSYNLPKLFSPFIR